MCNRALWFREFAQNGAAPSVHLERARELPNWGPISPRSVWCRTGNWLECWLAPYRTADHCPSAVSHLQVVWDYSKTQQKKGAKGWHPGQIFDDKLLKCTSRHHFWCCLWSKKWFAKCFCRNRQFFHNLMTIHPQCYVPICFIPVCCICSRSRWRAAKGDKRMVLVHTHGLFIT